MPNTREKLIELIQTAKSKKQYDFLFGNIDDAMDMKSDEEYIADHFISNGVTVQEWISVKDRLPECRVPVLTYGRKGAVGIGFVQPTSATDDGKVYFYARYGDSLPTHWMPLPQPPKGE